MTVDDRFLFPFDHELKSWWYFGEIQPSSIIMCRLTMALDYINE